MTESDARELEILRRAVSPLLRGMGGSWRPEQGEERAIDALLRFMDTVRDDYGAQHLWERTLLEVRAALDEIQPSTYVEYTPRSRS